MIQGFATTDRSLGIWLRLDRRQSGSYRPFDNGRPTATLMPAPNPTRTTAVQQLMVEDAIDRPIEITVWRNGALVDVIAVPRELDE